MPILEPSVGHRQPPLLPPPLTYQQQLLVTKVKAVALRVFFSILSCSWTQALRFCINVGGRSEGGHGLRGVLRHNSTRLPLHTRCLHIASLRATPTLHRPCFGRQAILRNHCMQGCVGAVRRVAEKLPGVQSVDIDLAAQKVVVKGANLDAAAVQAGVAKSGKVTELWQ